MARCRRANVDGAKCAVSPAFYVRGGRNGNGGAKRADGALTHRLVPIMLRLEPESELELKSTRNALVL
jgi:hypothetical protein